MGFNFECIALPAELYPQIFGTALYYHTGCGLSRDFFKFTKNKTAAMTVLSVGLVFKALQGCRQPSAAMNEIGRGIGADLHNGARTEQSAE